VSEGGWAETVGSCFSVPADIASGTGLSIGIRPEAFHLVETAGNNVLTGAVRLVEHMGSDLFVHLDVPGGDHPVIARLLAERAPHIASGQTLHLGVKPERLLLFAADGKRLRPRDQAASTVVQMKERLQ
jgi:multiple sugar transport system ATP-binding protein